jgi:hypothetical protein
MALSLWDQQRRLHDLEVALQATLGLLLAQGAAEGSLTAALQTLRSRGEKGAAALLGASAVRSYAR